MPDNVVPFPRDPIQQLLDEAFGASHTLKPGDEPTESEVFDIGTKALMRIDGLGRELNRVLDAVRESCKQLDRCEAMSDKETVEMIVRFAAGRSAAQAILLLQFRERVLSKHEFLDASGMYSVAGG